MLLCQTLPIDLISHYTYMLYKIIQSRNITYSFHLIEKENKLSELAESLAVTIAVAEV